MKGWFVEADRTMMEGVVVVVVLVLVCCSTAMRDIFKSARGSPEFKISKWSCLEVLTFDTNGKAPVT